MGIKLMTFVFQTITIAVPIKKPLSIENARGSRLTDLPAVSYKLFLGG